MSRLMIVEAPSYSCEFKGIREVRELVRCGECIHRKDYECDHITLDGTRCGVTDDWFCADGEREGE